MFSRKKRVQISPPVTPCPDCDGERVVVDGSLEMYLYQRGRALSRLKGTVCLDCGRVWWYAVELEKLRESLARRGAAHRRPGPATGHAGAGRSDTVESDTAVESDTVESDTAVESDTVESDTA